MLENITIPQAVESIGEYAFRDCTALQEIVIPSSVENMGEGIFFGCPDITVYCEAEAKPNGWNALWNFYGHWADEELSVTWNYKEKQ